MVTAQFEKFNASFKELEAVFEEITGRPFKPGQKFTAAETEGGQVRKHKKRQKTLSRRLEQFISFEQ